MSNRRPPGKDLVPSDGKVPVPERSNEIADFEVLKKKFDAQVKLFQEFRSAWQQRHWRVDLHREGDDVDNYLWTQTREGAEQCAADVDRRWGATDIHHPPKSYLVYRIGKMLKRMPEVKLPKPKDWAHSLAERLQAEDLNVMVHESVFRDIEDELGKPPKFPDVLRLLKIYKTSWQRRLAAIDLDHIQRMREEMVFAHAFKKAVFEEAVLEYLDAHGDVDLTDEMRDMLPYYIAIKAAARTEGLSELVAKMEASDDDDAFDEAQRILINKKHLTLEWDLLLKNAQRRVNHDKQFVCQGCAAGYDEHLSRCMVCDGAIVAHQVWDEQVTHEQQTLAAELAVERQRWQREQKRREKSARPWPRLWWGYLLNARWAYKEGEDYELALQRAQLTSQREKEREWERCLLEQSVEDYLFSAHRPLP